MSDQYSGFQHVDSPSIPQITTNIHRLHRCTQISLCMHLCDLWIIYALFDSLSRAMFGKLFHTPDRVAYRTRIRTPVTDNNDPAHTQQPVSYTHLTLPTS